MCEGGEGFVPCEPLPRDPQTLLKKGAHVENGDEEMDSNSSKLKSEANIEREGKKDSDNTSRVPVANQRASPDR